MKIHICIDPGPLVVQENAKLKTIGMFAIYRELVYLIQYDGKQPYIIV